LGDADRGGIAEADSYHGAECDDADDDVIRGERRCAEEAHEHGDDHEHRAVIQ
jgi:hypothetical protein